MVIANYLFRFFFLIICIKGFVLICATGGRWRLLHYEEPLALAFIRRGRNSGNHMKELVSACRLTQVTFMLMPAK